MVVFGPPGKRVFFLWLSCDLLLKTNEKQLQQQTHFFNGKLQLPKLVFTRHFPVLVARVATSHSLPAGFPWTLQGHEVMDLEIRVSSFYRGGGMTVNPQEFFRLLFIFFFEYENLRVILMSLEVGSLWKMKKWIQCWGGGGGTKIAQV